MSKLSSNQPLQKYLSNSVLFPLSLQNHAHNSSSAPEPTPMASLHKLLSQDGFPPQNSPKPTKKVKFRDRKNQQDSITLPIYICHDRRSFDSSSKPRSIAASSVISSHKSRSESDSAARSSRDEPTIDDAAVRAMVAILSGYIGQYSRDAGFRATIREKCRSCFERQRRKGSDSEIFSHMEAGIQSIERLVERETRTEKMDLESVQRCIKILNAVASSSDSSNGSSPSCRKTSSYLAACANLYLSIIYKICKNDKISARNLLQVFCDAPYLARARLLPELWDHFFLPHLLHLKIWYGNELENLARMEESEKERKIKRLNQVYHEQMDVGTIQFAVYYKEWLKVGAQAPSLPTVSLPSKSNSKSKSRRKSSESSISHHSSSSSKLLYQDVFGANMKGKSMDLDERNGSSRNVWDFEVQEDVKHCSYIEKKAVSHRRSSSLNYEIPKAEPWPDSQKSDYFRFLSCRTEPAESFVSSNEKIKVVDDINVRFQLSDVARAIATICSSQSLTDCEGAIRAVSEAWLSFHGDSHSQLESSLSRAAVIQGILEVLYVSNDDEILELAVSILAEIAAKNEANRPCILASDPQLVVAMRLMRSSSLFLKAAVLLYLVKPKAKQMVSMEWVPLVLRVLEFGDQMQTLFTVRCSPHEAAYYFLSQLLTGFDEDKNFENAKQIISLGGLGLLVRRMHLGDASEKSRAASVVRLCIRADGSCRHYLVKNMTKDAILALLVLENGANSQGHALALMSELLCVSRKNKRIEFLNGLKEGWKSLNTLHILMLRLQRARADERPMIAVVLLELDLLGNASECSVYREEAVDAIVESLDCRVFDESIQKEAAKALLILGGHFSYTGEEEVEKWLLRKAQLRENCFIPTKEDEEMNEKWQRKAALVLLSSGTTRLLSALSDSMANSIPCLARACLVTICWISSYLDAIREREFCLVGCSILVPRLIECLVDNSNNLEEKILASFSLHNLLTNSTDYFSQQPRIENDDVLGCLQKLSRATWTAKELISLITRNSLTER